MLTRLKTSLMRENRKRTQCVFRADLRGSREEGLKVPVSFLQGAKPVDAQFGQCCGRYGGASRFSRGTNL
jgi:hypothetical protein